MGEMTLLLLTLSVAWSFSSVLCFSTESSTTPLECNEPVITQCECGNSGKFQDFYVTSCLNIKENYSSYCGPCPGSCQIFMFCKSCTKNSCLSCPVGRRGRFCEITETTEAYNLNYTLEPADKMKSYNQERIDGQKTIDDTNLKSAVSKVDLNLKSTDIKVDFNPKSEDSEDGFNIKSTDPKDDFKPKYPYTKDYFILKSTDTKDYLNPKSADTNNYFKLNSEDTKDDSYLKSTDTNADFILKSVDTKNDFILKPIDAKDDSNQKHTDTISSKNLSPKKLAVNRNHKTKLGINENYRNKTAVIGRSTFKLISRNSTQSNMGKINNKNIFHLNVNPEFSLPYSNKTEKFTSIQNPKETVTRPRDPFIVSANGGFLIPVMNHENETDINDKINDRNNSLVYKVEYINPFVSDIRNAPFKHIQFSENAYLKEDKFEANANEKLNNFSNQWRFPFENPVEHNNFNYDELERRNGSSNFWKFPFQSPELHDTDNLQQYEKVNGSSNFGKLPFQSPEVHQTGNLQQYEKVNSSSNLWILPFEYLNGEENDSSDENQKLNSSFSQRIFPLEQAGIQPKISTTNPMVYRPAFVFGKSDFSSKEVSNNQTNKQSNSSEMLSESSKIQNPLKISIYNVTLFETENMNIDDAQYTNKIRNKFALDTTVRTLNTTQDQITHFPKNSSKEFGIPSPPKINVFRLTFVAEVNDNSTNNRNSNITEGRKIENGENTKILKHETLKIPKNIEIQSEAATPFNFSIFKMRSLRNDESSSFSVKNSNLTESRINGNGEKVNSSQTPKNKTLGQSQNVSSEISAPLNMSPFFIKFLGGEDNSSNSKQNSNSKKNKINENGKNTNASLMPQIKTLELRENMTVESETYTPLNVSVSEIKIQNENFTSSFEKKHNNTFKPTANSTETNSKERTANYKRNALNKPYYEMQNFLGEMYRKIMQSKYLTRSKARKFDDEHLFEPHSLNKNEIPGNHILMPLYFPQIYNTEYQNKISNNNNLQRLCELYPNYSPCFKTRMLTPGSPYTHTFDFRSQVFPNYQQYKSFPYGRFKYIAPRVIYGDYEDNINILLNPKNGQQRLTDPKTLDLGKQYFGFENAEKASSLPLQSSRSLGNVFISNQPKGSSLSTQEGNKGIKSEEGFDATLLSGILNHLFSLLFPKYIGHELPAQTSLLNKQDFYKNTPGQLIERNEEVNFSEGVNPPFKAKFFIGTLNSQSNKLLGLQSSGNELAAQSSILDQQDLYKKRPKQSALSSEEIDFPLNKNPVFRAEIFPDTYYHRYDRPFDFSKTHEDCKEHYKKRKSDEEKSVESMNVEIEPKLSFPQYESIQISLNIPSEYEQKGVLPFISNSKQSEFLQNETPAASLQERRIQESNYTSNEIMAFDAKEEDGKMEYSSEEFDGSKQKNITSKILPEMMMANWNFPYLDDKMGYSSEESDTLEQNKNTSEILPKTMIVNLRKNQNDEKNENSLEKLDEFIKDDNTTHKVLLDEMMKKLNIYQNDNKMEILVEEPRAPFQNENFTSKILPDKFLLANGTDISGKSIFYESAGDKSHDSCTMCVYSESIYEPFNDEENPIKTLPTIIRTLIIEDDDMLIGNQSDQKPNDSRKKRSSYNYGRDDWCPIQKQMLFGDLDCTIWTYQKACTIICHPGYTSKYRTFRCSRRTNNWTPQICACEPIKGYDGYKYRQGDGSLPADDMKILSDGLPNDTRTYNAASAKATSRFGYRSMDIPETSFSNFEPVFQEGQYGRGDQIINTSLDREIKSKLASEDAIRSAKKLFDTYETKESPENSSNQRQKYPTEKEEHNSQKSEPIYTFFEKEDAQPGRADSW